MHGREVERVGHLVEARHLRVFRQEILDIEPGQHEQVAERVFIFAAGHAPHANPALLRDPCLVGGGELAIEPLHDLLFLSLVRPLLVGRRHLASGDTVVDAHEPGMHGGIGEVARQRGQVEPRLGRRARMTRITVPLEERLERGGAHRHRR
jgi:hypothetical protein